MPEILHQNGAVEAAHVFRDILFAISRPGRLVDLRSAAPELHALQAGSLAVIATLCDYQTPVFLSSPLVTQEVLQWIRFNAGSPIVDKAGEAAFAVVDSEAIVSMMGALSVGTHEYPDRSTTVVVQLAGEVPGASVEFSGPGVGPPLQVSLPGLGAEFWAARDAANANYPLGIDFFFVKGRTMLACPRTTKARLPEMS